LAVTFKFSTETPQNARTSNLSSIMTLPAHWHHTQSMLRVFKNQETSTPFTHYPDSSQPALEALWEIFCFGRARGSTTSTGKSAGGIIEQSMASAKAVFMSYYAKTCKR
jgi:hypothetical protein